MKHLSRIFTAFFLSLLLLTAAGCASTPKQEGTGEYVDDAVISNKVRAALLNEPGLSSSDVKVETFKGVVQLSGFVAAAGDISKAADIARNVKGVKSVRNDILVK